MEKTSASTRDKIGVGLLGATFAFLVGAIIVVKSQEGRGTADPGNSQQVARGKAVYARNCVACRCPAHYELQRSKKVRREPICDAPI